MIQIHNPNVLKQWLNSAMAANASAQSFGPYNGLGFKPFLLGCTGAVSLRFFNHRRPTSVLEKKHRWGQSPKMVQLEKYLSWVIKQPLFPGLFLVGSYSFCHLMPYGGFHMMKHMIQPYFHLEEVLWVRCHRLRKFEWYSFLSPSLGEKDNIAPALYTNQMPEGKGRHFCISSPRSDEWELG